MNQSVEKEFMPNVDGKTIGLVGVGRMGLGIGKNLIRRGASLFVKGNVARNNIEQLIALGAIECRSLAEVAQHADIILLSLPSSKEVEETCFGEGGLLSQLSENALIIDMTTSDPNSTNLISAEAARRNIKFVDAPVTRTPKEADLGTLNAIIGCNPDYYHEVMNIMSAFCVSAIYAGDVGSAHKLKLLNNSITMGTVALLAESFNLAEGAGIKIETMHALISLGAANNAIFQGMCAYLLNDDLSALSFSLKNAEKDVRYICEMSKVHNVPTPVLDKILEKFGDAIVKGYAEETLPALVRASRA